MRGFYLVLLFILIIAPNNVYATSCELSLPADMYMPNINLVIKGQVIKAKRNYYISFLDGYGKEKIQELTFKVDEVLYGEYDKAEIKITEYYEEKDPDNGDVGFGFEAGEKYLAFVRKDIKGTYYASANGFCSEAWPLDSKRAETEIEKVKKYNNTKE